MTYTKKVKVWDWFVEMCGPEKHPDLNMVCRVDGKEPEFFDGQEIIKTIQKIDGTEREVER